MELWVEQKLWLGEDVAEVGPEVEEMALELGV